MVVTRGATRVHRIRLIGGLYTFLAMRSANLRLRTARIEGQRYGRHLHPMAGGTMRPVMDLLTKRDVVVWSIHPQDNVLDALKILAKYDVGALMVMEHGKLVGVFSERDYTRKIELQGRSSKETRVQDIMTKNVLAVSPRTGTKDCMALMSQRKIRHLPVVDGVQVLGMISIRDIMDDIIADHELTISYLQNYITS
jgi:CBS domain-containing protein